MGNKRTQESVIAERRARRSPDGRAGTMHPKHLAAREDYINQNPLVPMNAKQKEYIELINSKDTIIATGYAGTSKTYIPTVMACDRFRVGDITKIVFTRPNISNSKSLGYFGGDLVQKMENWLMPVMNILRDRLGVENVEIAIKNGDIEFVPMEVVKGYSAENCFFIVDEAEDLTYDEAKKIVTRQGKNCKMVLAGDISQSELKEKSGLKALIDISKEYSFIDLGLVDFNNKGDIVRGEACKNWIIGFERWEGRS